MASSASEREKKRAPLSLRTTTVLRDRLESAADMNGRSLTQEVEFRLERSLETDALMTALVGDQSHAQNLVRAIATVLRRVEGVQQKRFTDDWETLFYCRRAVNTVCRFVLGNDMDEADFLSVYSKGDQEKRAMIEQCDQYAFTALRDLGLALPPAPNEAANDMTRRPPLDPLDDLV